MIIMTSFFTDFSRLSNITILQINLRRSLISDKLAQAQYLISNFQELKV